ncbi:MAG TPA: LacI family DNA-binding transcriptional regulator [Mycobacteriales bacterium]|nr:LacI family DNA-binding transcriptional regulator [Mycobacteriales bacterium]
MPHHRRPTIADVARRAGVSTATVSLTMNDRHGVNPVTAQRVRRAAADLGWRPSARARALSRSRAQAIGIIIRRPAELIGIDPFFSNLIAGVESVLSRSENALVVRVVGDREQESTAYKAMVADGRVDGFLLTDLEMRDRRHEYLLECGLPALVVGEPAGRYPLPAVGTDERSAAREAVQHLIKLGHRRIGHVAGTAGYIHTRARQRAWRDALRAAGLPSGPVEAGGFSAAAGARATRQLLAGPEPPTAVFYANDLMALAGMSTAAERGITVPRQLSVVGFDDVELAAHASPPLTTIGRDTQDWGRQCATTLLALIDGIPVPHRTILPSHLMLRNSTAPPSRKDLSTWQST